MISPLENIDVTLLDRKWMKSAKAWRGVLLLPETDLLPEVLTAMIDTQVDVELRTDDTAVEIKPAYICDVPQVKKRFHLVLETVYEQQKNVGPTLTALLGRDAKLTIRPAGAQEKAAPPRGTITEQALKGLHSSFFHNRLFQQYIAGSTGNPVDDHVTCKTVFKAHLGVESCRHIMQEDFDAFLRGFNTWLKG